MAPFRSTCAWLIALVVFVSGLAPMGTAGEWIAVAHALDIGEAQCRECHCDNVPDRHHVLVGEGEFECLDCHEMRVHPDTGELYPEVLRDCMVCHGPSMADRHHLLSEVGAFECLDCHALVYDNASQTYHVELGFSCAIGSPCDGSAAGAPCSEGVGACLRTGEWVCDGAGETLVCSAAAGAPALEMCDEVDNDCDGSVDEDYVAMGLGSACSAGEGACTANGWMGCNPSGDGLACDAVPGDGSPEICDGIDNDCDGFTDEGFSGLGETCSAGEGGCERHGVLICEQDGIGTQCSAIAGAPEGEWCDGIDNDCDGTVDEDFGLGEACWVGEGVCRAEGITVCTDLGDGITCDALASPPGTEICDGLDNDCDGDTDEGFGVGEVCSVGVGGCARNGQRICGGDGTGTVCNAVAGLPEIERCNGIDDDCDGWVDEDFPIGGACTAGEGACMVSGLLVCDGSGAAAVCNAVPGTGAADDSLCDGVDNDCDGAIDEDVAGLGEPCAVGQGSCSALGERVCDGSGLGSVCDAVAGDESPEVCDGLDNDCDGSVDEGFSLGALCSVGVGACTAYGEWVCGDAGVAICSAEAGGPAAEICDGVDNDCDAAVDEDYPELGDPCSEGTGACVASGFRVCSDTGDGSVCNALPGELTDEICDGVDNDCDGSVDEDFGLHFACSAGVGVCLSFGETVCAPDGTGVVCNAVAGAPGTEVCDGLDNDCDAEVDEGCGGNPKHAVLKLDGAYRLEALPTWGAPDDAAGVEIEDVTATMRANRGDIHVGIWQGQRVALKVVLSSHGGHLRNLRLRVFVEERLHVGRADVVRVYPYEVDGVSVDGGLALDSDVLSLGWNTIDLGAWVPLLGGRTEIGLRLAVVDGGLRVSTGMIVVDVERGGSTARMP